MNKSWNIYCNTCYYILCGAGSVDTSLQTQAQGSTKGDSNCGNHSYRLSGACKLAFFSQRTCLGAPFTDSFIKYVHGCSLIMCDNFLYIVYDLEHIHAPVRRLCRKEY